MQRPMDYGRAASRRTRYEGAPLARGNCGKGEGTAVSILLSLHSCGRLQYCSHVFLLDVCTFFMHVLLVRLEPRAVLGRCCTTVKHLQPMFLVCETKSHLLLFWP